MMISRNDEATESSNIEHSGPPISSNAGETPTAGVFALSDQSQELDIRPGAKVTSWTDSDHLQSENQTDLPMIVWLRGDEPWYPEFDLDADAVMAQLGIKRSRLTQISGKDLRVGRVRVDRYIRPMYRSADVSAYSQWTRATASHQKSSTAIKEAVDALQSQSAQIAQAVDAANTSFKHAIDAGLADKLRDAAVESFDPLLKRIEFFELTANHLLLSMNSEIHRLESTLQERLDRYQCLNSTQWTSTDIRLESIETASAAISLRFAEFSEKSERILNHQLNLERYLQLNAAAVQTLTETVGQALKEKRLQELKSAAKAAGTHPNRKLVKTAQNNSSPMNVNVNVSKSTKRPKKLRSMRSR